MNKDVIYIDVEDDITAIISKVKASGEKIVALVPPKRVGVLQSAVNLRLLARAADQGQKRLVVITNNQSLAGLAASAQIPVARNLQSKPELAQVAALEIDDGEDVIDGNDLPVGDHARQTGDEKDAVQAAAVGSAAVNRATPPAKGEASKPPRAKSGASIPNFNTFRKKLILGVIAGVLLIAFAVWAIFFAPRATIAVSAKTSDSSVNAKVTVGDKLSTDVAKNTIKAVVVSKSEKKSIDFGASGSKNAGSKATGTVSLRNGSPNPVSVPAGTTLTNNGLNFQTTGSVTVPAATLSFSCQPNNLCPGTATVSITAPEGGAKYNAASGSMSGAPSGVSATLQGPTSGGTDKIVKVVTAADVKKAQDTLAEEDTKQFQTQLKSQLKNAKAIDGSFRADYTEVRSSPDVNGETESGNASLTATAVYTLYGVSDAEIGKFLDGFLKKQLEDTPGQRVYDNGTRRAEFQDVNGTDSGAELTVVATAKVGPALDESEIKRQSLGRKGGEIQEALQGIRGIEDVEVSYFPFWVSSVPDDEKKITVQFKVEDN